MSGGPIELEMTEEIHKKLQELSKCYKLPFELFYQTFGYQMRRDDILAHSTKHTANSFGKPVIDCTLNTLDHVLEQLGLCTVKQVCMIGAKKIQFLSTFFLTQFFSDDRAQNRRKATNEDWIGKNS